MSNRWSWNDPEWEAGLAEKKELPHAPDPLEESIKKHEALHAKLEEIKEKIKAVKDFNRKPCSDCERNCYNMTIKEVAICSHDMKHREYCRIIQQWS